MKQQGETAIVPANTEAPLTYLDGFGNEMQSEALPGSLPVTNNPRIVPHNLISELVSGAAFVAARAHNRRTYMFRIRPSTTRGPLQEFSLPTF